MPGGLTVTNQQPQLGLGFPAPPVDTSGMYFLTTVVRVITYA